MEYLKDGDITSSERRILCCSCGISIEPNEANMCVACIRTKVDITEGIPKQVVVYFCSGCERYLQPPAHWVACSLESKELLSLCLNKLRGLNQVRLVDACFVWTEPHSRRIKIKLTVQKEVMGGVILQQVVVIEYIVNNQMCDACHRREAKDFWNSVVQVRQKVDHKRTFHHLEQIILKHKIHATCLNIKPCHDGLDFYFGKKDDAKKFVDFLQITIPCRTNTSQRLISHDIHNNVYNYKHTFSVEIVPICKHDIVCLPPQLAQSLGSISQLCICYRVTNTVHLIDPVTLQIAELSSHLYWRHSFQSLSGLKQLTEYIVMENDHVQDSERKTSASKKHLSKKNVLSDVWVVKATELGLSDLTHCRTHLGHLLHPGDAVLGFDLANSNVNDFNFEKLKNRGNVPDVILLKKVYQKIKLETSSDDTDSKSISCNSILDLDKLDLTSSDHPNDECMSEGDKPGSTTSDHCNKSIYDTEISESASSEYEAMYY